MAPGGHDTGTGHFSFDAGYQIVGQDRFWDGSHPITQSEAIAAATGSGHALEQLTRTRLLLLNARAQLGDRLQVTASWPWVDRVHRHAFEDRNGGWIPSEWHMQGLGDATVMAHWRALGEERRSRTVLKLLLGIKLPTGQRHVEEIAGEEPEPPARPGTGSTDGLFGLQLGRTEPVRALGGRPSILPVHVTLLERVNGKGTESYRVGRQWQLDVLASYPLTPAIHLLGQLNGAVAGRDDVGATDADPLETGATSLFASPGLRVQVLPGLDAYGLYQIRLYQRTNGPTIVAPWHVAFGLGYAIGR